jgi:hypothetical protein
VLVIGWRVLRGLEARLGLVLRLSDFHIIVFQDVKVFLLLFLDRLKLFQYFGVSFLVSRENNLFEVVKVVGEPAIGVAAGMS